MITPGGGERKAGLRALTTLPPLYKLSEVKTRSFVVGATLPAAALPVGAYHALATEFNLKRSKLSKL